MTDVMFNVAKGKFAAWAESPGANGAFLLVFLQAAGLEADAVLKDYDTLSAVLAASNDEATFTGYSRVTLSGLSVSTNDTSDKTTVDASDPSAITNSGGSAQTIGAILLCYDPDTTGGTDANIIPVGKYGASLTFDPGVPVTIQISTDGLAEAA